MTNEEAVKYGTEWLKDEYLDARDGAFIKMALEALRQEPCEETQLIEKSNFSMEQYKTDIQSAYDCGRASVAPCKDTINRQAAIDTIESWLSCDNYNESERHIMRAMQSVLYDLPPVTPQPKMGRWSRVVDKTGHLVWECDKCGWQQRFNTNFCPDCGIKMEEVEG